MANLISRSFDQADERRTPPKAQVDVVMLDGTSAARLVLQPDWRWSECIKPIVGTETCQVRHVGHAVEPGHDAWVVGDEAFVSFEFESETAKHYAETRA